MHIQAYNIHIKQNKQLFSTPKGSITINGLLLISLWFVINLCQSSQKLNEGGYSISKKFQILE
jgi:hypothetical protein